MKTMKKYIKSLLCVAVVASMTACEIDELNTGGSTDQPTEVGYLKIGDVSVNLDTENASTESEPKTATRAVTEAATSYWVTVSNKLTNAVAWQGTYADAVSQQISLEPGTYVVSARQTQEGVVAGVAQDAPYYAGTSEDVVITSKQTSTATVTCKLANILTTVELSADLKAVFKPYDASSPKRLKTNVKVGTDAASNNFDFEASSTHEAPKMYFRDEAGLNATAGNTMTILLSGDYYTGDLEDLTNGTADETKWKEVKMTKTLTNVRAAQWRKISINISHPTSGNARFEIKVESYIYDEELVVDVVTLYEALDMEEAIPDDEEENPAAPSVTINGQSDLTYTLDSSKYDADAEAWTSYLKLNVVPEAGATVTGLYAVLTSDNASLQSAYDEMTAQTKGRIDLFPTNNLSEYCNVASDGQTITVKAAGQSALYEYAGTHTFSIYTTDSKNRMKHTDVVIVVDNGGSSGSGNAPTVVWMMDGKDVIDQQHVLTADNAADYTCVIDIVSKTGLTKLEVDIVSDVLTNEELQGIGLASHLDLVNPNPDHIDALQALGFLPNGATSLGGVKSVSFDISAFMNTLFMLFQEPDGCLFHLTVADAGGETKKTLDIFVQK
ncbi:MAG: DUF4493 domain-containing protein [Alistipes sp.]|nr:DUF4493 domain-containing protein [Alistipes sp.]